MTQSKHTPTPWNVTSYDTSFIRISGKGENPLGLNFINGKSQEKVASTYAIDGLSNEAAEANAAFIVKAVNNHEALVNFIEKIAESHEAGIGSGIYDENLPEGILELIAAAKCDA